MELLDNIARELKKLEASAKTGKSGKWKKLAGAGVLAALGFAVWFGKGAVTGAVLALWGGAAAAAGLVLFFPRAALAVEKTLFALVLLLSGVVLRFFLAALFYAVFTPIALVLRLQKKDLLSLKLDPGAASYWRAAASREGIPDPHDRMF